MHQLMTEHGEPFLTGRASTWSALLENRAACMPEQVGFRFLTNGETCAEAMTYDDLDQRARQIAAQLQIFGIKPGAPVMVICPPGADFVAAMFGVWHAAAVAVPAPPPEPLRQSTPGTVRRRPAADRLARIADDVDPAAVLCVSVDLEAARACFGDTILCLAIDAIGANDVQWHRPDLDGDDLALIQYTSGSTGEPRGIELTHAQLLANARTIADCAEHTPQSRGLIWLPPYHDMGLIGGILQPIFAGFPVTLMPPAAFVTKPLRWLRAISDTRATTSAGPSFAYDLTASAVENAGPAALAGIDLSSWDVAFNGAEPIDAAVMDRFARVCAPLGFKPSAFYPCYGLAEATLLVSGGAKRAEPIKLEVDAQSLRAGQVDTSIGSTAKTLVSCGHVRAGHEVLVRAADGSAAPDRHVGELWIASPALANGYHGQPNATARTFVSHDGTRYLRSGDLGFIHTGELFVVGRCKDVLIVRGQNHYPHDLEATVQASHEALQVSGGAAVLADVDGTEALCVVQSLQRTHRNAEPEPICAAVRAALAEMHGLAVQQILLVKPGAVPITASGKIRRSMCREMIEADGFEPIFTWTAADPPAGTAEGTPYQDGPMLPWLTERFAAALHIEPDAIDPTEPLAAYGLDSVGAVGLVCDLEQASGVELDATVLWDYPTLGELAAYLEVSRQELAHA